MTQFFQFEADFVDSLRCIPMQVRFKLDTCGVKLKLPHWNQFTHEERQMLVETLCVTDAETQAYRQNLRDLVHTHTGELPSDLPIDPHPAWLDASTIPESVQEEGHSLGVTITLEQWVNLSPLQRFALIKLSRSQHENKNFLPALKEFQLA
ncbi:MAG: nitrate reductase maturation protein NarM [Cyanobacteria bacterium CRU_2_1]|nr:nitrate reductase maturation protein NarM [Cyanobacteria bacterium RU_5_0]NJR61145.1 nitrate reductase maturation protein NarM [Cyanobacteria bacterium CRU_2_1]